MQANPCDTAPLISLYTIGNTKPVDILFFVCYDWLLKLKIESAIHL